MYLCADIKQQIYVYSKKTGYESPTEYQSQVNNRTKKYVLESFENILKRLEPE